MASGKKDYFAVAADEAHHSLCLRRKCGSVIVKDNKIIGRGFNGPPQNNLKWRHCNKLLDKLRKYPTDKTCCIHAEIRAINDALIRNSKKIQGADLYFASVSKSDKIIPAKKPYCTICSKQSLEVNLARVWLWLDDGPHSYNTVEYHEISRAANRLDQV
ncbi:MAG: deaminase [bacterium]|nr:deaminase [bacterium]